MSEYTPVLAGFAVVPFAESGVLYEPVNTAYNHFTQNTLLRINPLITTHKQAAS